MAGRKPGEKYGGRKKGTPNKATVEKAIEAAEDFQRARAAGVKLAKERLQELGDLFSQIAAQYRPGPSEDGRGIAWPGGQEASEPMFNKYASLAMQAYRYLAPYQSPTFKSITMATPDDPATGPGGPPLLDNAGNVLQFRKGDPVAAMRLYQRLIGGSIAPRKISGTSS